MSSKERSVCSRRDFLRGFGRRFFPREQGPEASSEVQQGRVFFEQNNYFMAARCFRSFLQENSESVPVRVFLGVSLYWCGRCGEALEILQGVTEGTHPLVLLYKSLCLATEGQVETALAVLAEYKDFTRPLVQRAVNVQLALREENLPVSAQEMEKDIREAVEREGEPLIW